MSSVALITPHPTPSTPPPSAPKQVEIAVSAFFTNKYWPTLALIKPPAAIWYFFCTPGTWDKHPRPKNIKSERSDFSPNHWTSTLINFGRKKPFLSDFAFYAMNRKLWYKKTWLPDRGCILAFMAIFLTQNTWDNFFLTSKFFISDFRSDALNWKVWYRVTD